jgi:ubiquinone/menaquinone biosynthesis C-methylase UbiE
LTYVKYSSFYQCFDPNISKMSTSGFSELARSGFGPAQAYDTHRPTYPSSAVSQLLINLEIANKSGVNIGDLAAGTGKFTEILSARPEKYEITAIEPHDGMRGELERKGLDRVTVVKGTGEKMDGVGDESFDAVVAAQVSQW